MQRACRRLDPAPQGSERAGCDSPRHVQAHLQRTRGRDTRNRFLGGLRHRVARRTPRIERKTLGEQAAPCLRTLAAMQLERTIAAVLAGGATLGVLAFLVVPAPGRAPRPGVRPLVVPAITAPPPGETAVLACSSVAPDDSAGAALASIGRKLAARAAVADAASRLEAELVATPANADKAGLRVRLERLLRERPELAPGVVRAFAKLEDRETLFVVSRALVECSDRADVRAAFDAAATNR